MQVDMSLSIVESAFRDISLAKMTFEVIRGRWCI